MAASQPHYALQNGNKIPAIGFGTFHSGVKDEIRHAVKIAIDAGYRHFDGAAVYGNEKEIGETFAEIFKEGKVKREDLFITSKLWNDQHKKEHVRPALEKTLKDLQLSYLDLYLVHFPVATKYTGPNPNPANGELSFTPISETWAALEELVHEGLVKNIGISNFNVQLTLDLLSYAKIKPQVNQVEIHPLLTQTALVEFHRKHNILIQAYFPLGGHHPENQKSIISHETVLKIAEKHKRTPAQILLRWSFQLGLNPLPKSANPVRIKENFAIFDFELSKAEVDELLALDRNERINGPQHLPVLPPIFA